MRSFPDFDGDVNRLHLQQIGDSVGILLPDDVVARMKLHAGDIVRLTEQADGSLLLSPVNADVARTIQIANEVMGTYRDTFAALAK